MQQTIRSDEEKGLRPSLKAELDIDTTQMAEEIAREVIKELKPLLKNNRAEDDTLFTVQTLAEYLEVSPQWVYEKVHLKEIPFIKMGKFPRFRKAEIDRWLEEKSVPVAQAPMRPMKLVKG